MTTVNPKLEVYLVPDERSDACTSCNSTFGIVLRKHHCRSCGKIFCYNCCSEYQSIPSYLPRAIESATVLRICKTCHEYVKNAKKHKKLIFILSSLPLTLFELVNIMPISKSWNKAISHIISNYKGIQYKTSYSKWSKLERRILSYHWTEWVGHSRMMVQSIRGLIGVENISTLIRQYKETQRKSPCSLFFCDIHCSEKLSPFDLFELLCAFPALKILENQEAEVWIGTELSKMHVDWHCIFMPWWLQMGYTKPMQRIIHNYILPLTTTNLNLAYKMFFECRFIKQNHRHAEFYIALMERILQMQTEEIQADIARSEHFITKILKKDYASINDITPVKLPYNPACIVQSITLDAIKQLNSYTKPWVVPMKTNYGQKSLLVKSEDVRKDRLVVITMYIITQLVPNCKFTPYSVFPVTQNTGWIEMVPNTTTLYDIKTTGTLQNYILEQNINKTTLELRRMFIQTCASNCLLSFMLGIGDRNLMNILIAPSGNIINIDFSYLLGTDPKWDSLAEMRITDGMVDMLGGMNSSGYNEMKKFCSHAYKKMRKYTYFWFTMFKYLAITTPPIYPHYGDLISVKRHIQQRLMTNFSDEEVELQIVNIVDKNSGGTWTSMVSDWTHSLRTSIGNLVYK